MNPDDGFNPMQNENVFTYYNTEYHIVYNPEDDLEARTQFYIKETAKIRLMHRVAVSTKKNVKVARRAVNKAMRNNGSSTFSVANSIVNRLSVTETLKKFPNLDFFDACKPSTRLMLGNLIEGTQVNGKNQPLVVELLSDEEKITKVRAFVEKNAYAFVPVNGFPCIDPNAFPALEFATITAIETLEDVTTELWEDTEFLALLEFYFDDLRKTGSEMGHQLPDGFVSFVIELGFDLKVLCRSKNHFLWVMVNIARIFNE
jgi:hypothetical protein